MPNEDVAAVESALSAAISGPKRVKTDAAEVEQHTVDEYVKAAQYLGGSAAGSRPRRGLRMTKVIPPGAV